MGGHGHRGLMLPAQRRRLFAQQTDGGFTVHLRHLQIDQQEIPAGCAPALQRLPAVAHHLAAVTQLLQQPSGDLLINQVVLSQQDMQPGLVPDRFRNGGWRCRHHRRGKENTGDNLMQFALRHRFMQIVGDTDALKHIGVKMAAHGAEHNNLALPGFRQGGKLQRQGYAVHIRHLCIQQDQRPGRPFGGPT